MDILLTTTLVVMMNMVVIESALATAQMKVSFPWKLMLLESTSS